MFWILVVLQWLHVLFAIFWFGFVMTLDFLIIPTVQTLEPRVQQAFGGAFGRRVPKVITPVASTVILLGVLRGIAGGVLGRLGSAYGLTWIAALVITTGLLLLGIYVLTPLAQKLQSASPGPEFDAILNRLKGLTVAELVGFLVVISLMIAMRFGY